MEIRFAQISDKMACESFNMLMDSPDNLDEEITRSNIIMAQENGQIIGYLRLEKLWNNLPFISMIHVVSTHRRQGVGKQLVRFVEENLSKTNIVISSSKSNDSGAISWHKASGFEPCGDWKATHADGCDELFFKKVVGV